MKRTRVMRVSYLAVGAALAFWLSACVPPATALLSLTTKPEEAQSLLNAVDRPALVARESCAAAFARGLSLWLDAQNEEAALAAFERAGRCRAAAGEAELAKGLVLRSLGRVDKAAAAYVDACVAAPESEACARSAAELSEIAMQLGEPAGKLAPLGPLLNDPRLHPAARLKAAALFARTAREAGEPRQSAVYEAQSGRLSSFAFYGPFSRLAKGRLSESTPNAQQLARETKRLPAQTLPEEPGLYAAAACIRASAPVKAWLQLATNLSAILTLNGAPLISRDARGAYLPQTQDGLLTLAPGAYTLMAKLAIDEEDSAFELHLVSPSGGALPLVASPGPCAPDLAFGGAAQFAATPPPKDGDARTVLWALLDALQRGDSERAKRLLARAQTRWPKAGFLDVLGAALAERDEGLKAERKSARALARHAEAAAKNPRLAQAQWALANEELARNEWPEALSRLAELERQAPNNALWAQARFRVAFSQRWQKEAREALDKALAINGRDVQFWKEVKAYADSQADFELAKRAALALARLNPEGGEPAAFMAENGDLPRAQEGYAAKEDARTPSRFLASHVLLDWRQGQFAKAVDRLRSVEGAPDFGLHFGRLLAESLALNDELAAAQAVYSDLAKSQYGDLAAQQALVAFGQPAPLQEEQTPFAAALAAYQAESWESEASAVVLLDESLLRFGDNGEGFILRHTITRLASPEAFARYGEIALPSGSWPFMVGVHKADGRLLLASVIPGKRTLSLPALDVGDAIEISTLQSTRGLSWPAYSGLFLFNSADAPIFVARLVVSYPQGRNYAVEANALAPKPERETKDGRTRLTATARRVPIWDKEPLSLEPEQTCPAIRVTHQTSWVALRDALREELLGRRRPSVELDEFLRGLALPRPIGEAQVARLYAHLTETIEGENTDGDFSQDATQILLSGKGNRLLLLGALLDRLGVPNRLVLAAPPILVPRPPAEARGGLFDNPLLVVWPDSAEPLIQDGSLRESSFNRYSPLLSGGYALEIEGQGGPLFSRLPWRLPLGDAKSLILELTLTPEGAGSGTAVEEIGGYYAASLKRAMKKLDPKRRERFLESVLNQSFRTAKLLSLEVTGLDDPAAPLRLSYAFTAQNLARRYPGQLRMEALPFPLSLAKSYISGIERQNELVIAKHNLDSSELIVHLPKGYTLSGERAPIDVEGPFGRYVQTSESKDGILRIRRDLALPISRIPPAAYPAFCRFVSAIEHAERQGFLFKEGAPGSKAAP